MTRDEKIAEIEQHMAEVTRAKLELLSDSELDDLLHLLRADALDQADLDVFLEDEDEGDES